MAGNDRHRSRGGGAGKAGRGGRHVVVVESPAKARSISRYLGPCYRVSPRSGGSCRIPLKVPDAVTVCSFPQSAFLHRAWRPYVATGDELARSKGGWSWRGRRARYGYCCSVMA